MGRTRSAASKRRINATRPHPFPRRTAAFPQAHHTWAARDPQLPHMQSALGPQPGHISRLVCHVRATAAPHTRKRRRRPAVGFPCGATSFPHAQRMRNRLFWVQTPAWPACVNTVAATQSAASGTHAIHGKCLVGLFPPPQGGIPPGWEPLL